MNGWFYPFFWIPSLILVQSFESLWITLIREIL